MQGIFVHKTSSIFITQHSSIVNACFTGKVRQTLFRLPRPLVLQYLAGLPLVVPPIKVCVFAVPLWDIKTLYRQKANPNKSLSTLVGRVGQLSPEAPSTPHHPIKLNLSCYLLFGSRFLVGL